MMYYMLWLCLLDGNATATSVFPYSEFLALEDFYDALNGDFWLWRKEDRKEITVHDNYLIEVGTITNHGSIWNFTGFHDPCAEAWQGVNCTCSNATNIHNLESGTNCTVISVELAAYNLTGRLPLSIDGLTNLRLLYLDSNFISGPLPSSIGNLDNLHFLSLANNYLTSSIPSELGSCSNLQHLHLDYNQMDGTIPIELFGLSQLRYLNLQYNSFHGEFTSMFGQLTNLWYLYLNDNYFTGTVPAELGNCTQLRDLYLYNSYFHGSIPDSLGQLIHLNYFFLFNNQMTGSIPAWVGSNDLIGFDGGLNQLTGSLPETLCGVNFTLAGILLNANQLTGTIPSCIGGSQSPVVELILYYNHLTGTIPSELSMNRVLESLVVGENHLSGTVPSLGNAKLLEFFYVQNNMLTGNLYDIVQGDQLALNYVDFSNNQFTGSIPSEFYGLKFLKSIALVSNCFTGSLSDEICNMERLEYLDFDGLHTADNCQHHVFPWIRSYGMGTHISGTVPPCLFSLPKLQTIHMSGNAIDSSLPNDLTISDSLTDVTLSHNRMRGSIPVSLQTRRFETLDLSYNCFEGVLHGEFNVSGYTSVEVNRLSGNVPPVFRHAHNIRILNSNMFGCDVAKSTLPLNDPNYSAFQCGSNAFDQSLIMWGLLAGIVLVFLLAVYWTRRFKTAPRFVRLKVWLEDCIAYFEVRMSIYVNPGPHDHIEEFAQYLVKLRTTFVRLTLVCCVLLLPLYFILSAYYSTHTYEYAWNASALYLSGETPAVILLFVFTGLLVFIFASLRNLLLQWIKEDGVIADVYSNKSDAPRLSFNRGRFIVMCIVASINCVMMLVLNGVYVYFVLEFDPIIVFLCQLMIAMIKIFWNEYALTWMIRRTRETTRLAAELPVTRTISTEPFSGANQCNMDRERDLNELKELQDLSRLEDANDMPVLTFIVIFNTIVAPLVANAVVSDQCYTAVFFPPAVVTSTGTYSVCQQEHTLLVTNVFCLQETTADLNTSYDPPFIYRYGCSSAFIRHYASVYVYMFLLTGFGKPLGFALWKYLYDTTQSLALRGMMSNFLNKLLKEDSITDARLQSAEILFRKERFVLNNVSATCVLLTVGVVFPPIAVVVLFAIYSHTYMNQFIIGRFVKCFDGIRQELVLKNLNRDCEGVPILFKNALLFMIPFTSCFYAFYLLDIYGDAVGWRKALWAPVVIFSIPSLVYFTYQIYRIFRAINRQRQENSDVKEVLNQNKASLTALLKLSSYYRSSSGSGLALFRTSRGRSSTGAASVNNPMNRPSSVEMTQGAESDVL